MIGSFGSTEFGSNEFVAPFEAIEYLEGSLSAESTLSATIKSTSKLVGSLDGQSTLEGTIKSIQKLVGSLDGQSTLEGTIKSTSKLVGSLDGQSTLEGTIKLVQKLAGSLDGQSTLSATIKSIQKLVGSLDGQSSAFGSLIKPLQKLGGSLDGQSTVEGTIYELLIGIYEQIANNISTCFYILAEINNLIVKYDNDFKDTPTDEIWCRPKIDFGKAKEADIGTDYLRIPGIFNVIIHSPIGRGTTDVLNIADIISTRFKTAIVDETINFQTPRIENVGRVEDNYQVNVICPFFADN